MEELAPARSLARHPLFQVMLTLQNNTEAVLDLPGLQTVLIDAGRQPAKFDLAFIWARPSTPTARRPAAGRVTFAADLFDRRRSRTSPRLLRVLEAVTADPQAPVDRIDVLDPAERHAGPVGVERHRAGGAAGHAAGAVRGPGGPHAGGHRGGLRGHRADVRGAERAGEPAGAVADRAGVGPESLVAVVMDAPPTWWSRCWRC